MIAPAYMDNERLGELIHKQASKILGAQPGLWKFERDSILVFVVTDESHNRMRIMSPITDVNSIPDTEWPVLMSANFDRALDARYCVNSETLWSAFIHPLAELGHDQFLDGLDQVVTLAKNYGTSYSSSNLVFQ